MIEEQWLDVPGYEGLYQASSFGRVKRLARTISQGNRYGTITVRMQPSLLLKTWRDRDGYMCVTSKVLKERYVHRIVALTFVPEEINKHYVNHVNGDVSDNHVENLQWVTSSENHIHAFDVLKRKPPPGKKIRIDVYTVEGNFMKSLLGYKSVADFCGVTKSSVNRALKTGGKCGIFKVKRT